MTTLATLSGRSGLGRTSYPPLRISSCHKLPSATPDIKITQARCGKAARLATSVLHTVPGQSRSNRIMGGVNRLARAHASSNDSAKRTSNDSWPDVLLRTCRSCWLTTRATTGTRDGTAFSRNVLLVKNECTICRQLGIRRSAQPSETESFEPSKIHLLISLFQLTVDPGF